MNSSASGGHLRAFSFVQGKLLIPSMNRNSCKYKFATKLTIGPRQVYASGRQMVGNRLKSVKNHLLFGWQRVFDAAVKTPSRPKCINNLSPTTDNLQKTILRPLTTNCQTNIVRGCKKKNKKKKKVGDRSLRVSDHANTGSMLLLRICKSSYIFIMFLYRKPFDI